MLAKMIQADTMSAETTLSNSPMQIFGEKFDNPL